MNTQSLTCLYAPSLEDLDLGQNYDGGGLNDALDAIVFCRDVFVSLRRLILRACSAPAMMRENISTTSHHLNYLEGLDFTSPGNSADELLSQPPLVLCVFSVPNSSDCILAH